MVCHSTVADAAVYARRQCPTAVMQSLLYRVLHDAALGLLLLLVLAASQILAALLNSASPVLQLIEALLRAGKLVRCPSL